MKALKIVAIGTLGLAIAAAAPASAAGKKDKPPRKEKAPIVLPVPPAGKGQIVFFRSGTIMGAAMGCSVNESGQKVSSLGVGRYFVMVTEPGRHEFTVKSEAKDVLALEVEPDETQFASCSIKMGLMAGRPDIKPATEAEFREHDGLDLVDDDDMGPGPGALRANELSAALAVQSAAPVAPTEAGPQPAGQDKPANGEAAADSPAGGEVTPTTDTVPAETEGTPAAVVGPSAAPAGPAQ
jgi:hypothetical protein